MTWISLSVTAPAEAREALGAWLVARTGQAVEERSDGVLVAYAADAASADRLVHELEARGEGVGCARHEMPDIDWTQRWREGIPVRRIGRLTVAPSWLAADALDGPRVVIDPEMAFGTGEHGSTRAALALLERHVRPGDRMLDLGSGSGILAISAVLLGARQAIGIEVDEEANVVAESNAERNGVADRVRFIFGDAAQLAPVVGPAEILCSNILRLVNVALLPEIRATLTPRGLAIFSGMEATEASEFRAALAEQRFTEVDDVVDAGWWAVAART
ncbi:MAG: 50S ribosomal protein L11 methyltransferase [Gemmatimonadales bacterium]|jgi:ribosomal protein L11 methyltransferase|nr:50S ribosomal protein L11 methyltransferase [Gemmatimonadales bacterium]